MSSQLIPKLMSLIKSHHKSIIKNNKEEKLNSNYPYVFGFAIVTLLIVKGVIDENKYYEPRRSHDIKRMK